MDTAIRLCWLTAAFFLLVAIVSGIGEVLGWWNLIGEIGMSVGSTMSVLVTLVAVVLTSGRQQVTLVGEDVRSVNENVLSVNDNVLSLNENVLSVNEGMHSLNDNVVSVDENVQENGARLERIAEHIAGEDGMLRELDAIELELDAQTGVLADQLTVLGEVRDHLSR